MQTHCRQDSPPCEGRVQVGGGCLFFFSCLQNYGFSVKAQNIRPTKRAFMFQTTETRMPTHIQENSFKIVVALLNFSTLSSLPPKCQISVAGPKVSATSAIAHVHGQHQRVVVKTNDRKLCAYLKMGLSSKEMASLLNTSVRSIETARYRLRKKLDMEQGSNLTDFIQMLDNENIF